MRHFDGALSGMQGTPVRDHTFIAHIAIRASLVRDVIGIPSSVFSLIRPEVSDQKLLDGSNSRGCRHFVIAKMWASFDAWITGVVGLPGLAVYDQPMFTLFQMAVAGSSGLRARLR